MSQIILKKKEANHSFVATFLFLFVAFPYVSIIHTPTDVQPLALIWSIIIFLLYLLIGEKLYMPITLWIIFMVVIYAFFMFFIRSEMIITLSSIRSMTAYLSLYFIAFACYKTFKHLNWHYYLVSVYVWLFFGLMQVVYSENFGAFLLMRQSLSFGRGSGVTSLAAEPSFYGAICIYFIVFNDIFFANNKYSKKVYYVTLIVIIIQIIISSSAVGFLLLMVYLFIRATSAAVFDKNLKRLRDIFLSLSLAGVILYSFLNIEYLQLSRPGRLLQQFIAQPDIFIYLDGSLAVRMVHIIVPILSLPYSYGLGFGLGRWGDYSDNLVSLIGGMAQQLVDIRSNPSGRIQSGWGAPIFEIGVFAILLMVVFVIIIYKSMQSNKSLKSVYFTAGLVVFLLTFNAIPTSFPFLGYFIGVILHYTYQGSDAGENADQPNPLKYNMKKPEQYIIN